MQFSPEIWTDLKGGPHLVCIQQDVRAPAVFTMRTYVTQVVHDLFRCSCAERNCCRKQVAQGVGRRAGIIQALARGSWRLTIAGMTDRFRAARNTAACLGSDLRIARRG